MRITSFALLAFTLFFFSCNEEKGQTHGPIVMGDSSTIVTETDPQYLADIVTDLQPPAATQEKKQTVAAPDTVKQAPAAQPQPAPGNGLNLAFKEVTVFIPGIEVRSYKTQDLSRSSSAVYELKSGRLAGNQIRITGGNVTKISQRYQTVLAIEQGGKRLELSTLPAYTSSWESLNGSSSVYPLKGLSPKELDYRNVSAAAIRSAVQKATRAQRMSKAEAAAWDKTARTVKSAKQSPVVIELKAVMWRIQGKGFSKEIRMDLPQ